MILLTAVCAAAAATAAARQLEHRQPVVLSWKEELASSMERVEGDDEGAVCGLAQELSTFSFACYSVRDWLSRCDRGENISDQWSGIEARNGYVLSVALPNCFLRGAVDVDDRRTMTPSISFRRVTASCDFEPT